jgi:hypothetical protein
MDIYRSMTESPSPSFKLETSVENTDDKSILTVKTPKNGDMTIISKNTIREITEICSTDFPYFKVYEKSYFEYCEQGANLYFNFTKDGTIDRITFGHVHFTNLGVLTTIEDLTFDLSKTTLKDMLADVSKETDANKKEKLFEKVLKNHSKQNDSSSKQNDSSESPSTLKWVLIVLGVLFMIGGFWFLNKESYEIVNAKQV